MPKKIVEETVDIETEILDATGEKPQGKKEDRQVYLRRLVKFGNKDDAFFKVSLPAKSWLQAGVGQYNTGTVVEFDQPVPEYVEDGEGEGEAEETQDEPPVEPPPARRGRPPAARTEEPPADEPTPPPARRRAAAAPVAEDPDLELGNGDELSGNDSPVEELTRRSLELIRDWCDHLLSA